MENIKSYTETCKRDIIRRAIVLGFVLALIGVLIGLILYSKIVFDIGVLCPLKEILGIECPGCGGTRMAVSIFKMDLYQAFRYNAYVFATIPLLLFVGTKQAYEFIVNNKMISWIDKFITYYSIGLCIFGVIRNIGVFSWLAPTMVR